VRHAEPDLGHQLAQDLLGDIRQVLRPAADVEGLPAAILLAQQRLADDTGRTA
jgi:hypothetical protein